LANREAHRMPLRLGRFLLLLSPAILAACSGLKAPTPAASSSPKPVTVQTTDAKTGSVAPTLHVAGVIAPYRQFALTSAINEPLAEIRANAGDHVGAGEVLATLDTSDLDAELESAQRTAAESQSRLRQQIAQSQINGGQYRNQLTNAAAAVVQAKAALRGAAVDRVRYAKLYAQGFLSQQVLAQQDVTVAQDRQAVDAARAQYAQMQTSVRLGMGAGGIETSQIDAAQQAAASASATVTQLRRLIARATLVAPSGGTIEAVNANVGEYPSGRQLFTLDDDARKYAIFSSSTDEALRIGRGEHVVVSVSNGSIKAGGTVEALLDQLSPGSTNFTVKVRLDDPPETLRPGMPVGGVVDLPHVHGTVVPISAFTDQQRTAVFVVEHGKARQHEVHDEAEDGDNAVVRGLDPGVEVVAQGQGTVSDGDPVKSK